MRAFCSGLVMLLAGTSFGQAPGSPSLPPSPAPTLLPPVPAVAPPVVPTGPVELQPPPPGAFNVGTPVSQPQSPGTVVRPPTFPDVRPPAPVSTAPTIEPPGPQFWADFEFLRWRARGEDVPPLVGAGTGLGTNEIAFISDRTINKGAYNGGRLTAGMWLEQPRLWGVEARYFWLNAQTEDQQYTTNSNLLVRPFVDARSGLASFFVVAAPNAGINGMVLTRSSMDSDGAEANVLWRAAPFIGDDMHMIVGLRYWGINEQLYIESSTRQPNPVTYIGSFDEFRTRNQFYGGQFGGLIRFNRGRLTVEYRSVTAIGAMMQDVSISGTSARVTATSRTERPGGLLALSTNIGDYERTRISMLQDVSLSLNYRVFDWMTVTLGYNAMAITQVTRPGAAVDLAVNPTYLPFSGTTPSGVQRPMLDFKGEFFWMHGISVGMLFKF